MILKSDNPTLRDNEKTWLTRVASDGDTSLTVESNEGFSANDYVVIGEVGEEDAECVKVSSTSGDHTIVAAAIKHDHPQGTPIYFTYYNQYSWEAKASGGSYGVIAGMPNDIEWDSLISEHLYSGETTDTYKYRLYNAQTAEYSSYSPEVAGTGHARNSVRYMTERVLQIARDPEARVATKDEIRRWFNTCQDHISSLHDKWWFLLTEDTAVTGVASTSQYALTEDYDGMDHLICHFDDGTTSAKYRLEYVEHLEFESLTQDQDMDDDDDTVKFTIWPADDTHTYGSFEVYPTPEHAYHTFYPWIYKKMTDLEDDNDTTDIPMPDILENFALAQLEKTRGNDTKSQIYKKNVKVGIDAMKRWQKNKTQKGQPRAFKFKGRTGLKRYYGERNVRSDDAKINYW